MWIDEAGRAVFPAHVPRSGEIPMTRSSRGEKALTISDFGFQISDFRASLLTSAATSARKRAKAAFGDWRLNCTPPRRGTRFGLALVVFMRSGYNSAHDAERLSSFGSSQPVRAASRTRPPIIRRGFIGERTMTKECLMVGANQDYKTYLYVRERFRTLPPRFSPSPTTQEWERVGERAIR